MNKAYIVYTFVTTRIVRDVLNLQLTGKYYYLHAHNNKMLLLIIIYLSVLVMPLVYFFVRWSKFVQLIQTIDGHARNLWKKDVNVNYSEHIGGGVYVSVTSPYKCVDIRKFFLPYGLDINVDDPLPSKQGVSLKLNEWCDVCKLLPDIRREFAVLYVVPCCDRLEHDRQYPTCSECYPFD